jgi:hypothetical protein
MVPYEEKRRLADTLMTQFGAKDKRLIWSFLRHCEGRDMAELESDMEHSLRVLRRDDKQNWFW